MNQQQLERYARVAAIVGLDSLHDLLARRGLDVLSSSISYVVQACRWRKLSRARRTRREDLVDELPVTAIVFQSSARHDRRALATFVGQLNAQDAQALQAFACGFDDAEISAQLGINPNLVRQRRFRAVRRLRQVAKLTEGTP